MTSNFSFFVLFYGSNRKADIDAFIFFVQYVQLLWHSFFARRAYVLSKCSLVLFLGNIIWVVSCDSGCECQGEYLGKK